MTTVHHSGTFSPPTTIYCTDTTHATYPSEGDGYLYTRASSHDVTVGGVITKYAYLLGDTSNTSGYANHIIHLDTSTNTWVDGHATQEPDPIEHVPGDYWVRWRHGHQASNVWYYFEDQSSWYSGSGSGSGRQTLSGGTDPEIINVEFTRTGELTVEMEFEHQNVNSVTVRKLLPDNTLTSATQNLTGSSTTITYTLSFGDTWWIEHPDFLDLPRYKLERVKWTLNESTGVLKAKGWFPDNGGNGFGGSYDVGLSGSTHIPLIVDAEFKSTSEEMQLSVTYNPDTLYRVLNIDTTQYGDSFTTKPLPLSRVFRNFW